MQCPNCQAEIREGAAFCGSCGAAVESSIGEPPTPAGPPMSEAPAEMPAASTQPLETPAPPPPLPSPTQPLPPPVAPQPVAPSAGYPAQAHAAQGYSTPPAGPAGPPKKSKAPVIIAIVVIVLLLICGCAVAGAMMYLPVFEKIEEVTPGSVETPVTPTESAGPVGFATADEAVLAALEAEDIGDWVYQVYDETDGMIVYWAGPPASEWVYAISVQRAPDGSWEVVSLDTLDLGGGDVSEGDLTPYDQAANVVGEHLYAVMQDRGMDAQALTVDPFKSDPASAQEAAGALGSFEVLDVREQSDGTFWVQSVQNWTWGVERWEYWVVPTELGYRIADIRPW